MKQVKKYWVDGKEVTRKDYDKALDDELHSHNLKVTYEEVPDTYEERIEFLESKIKEFEKRIKELEDRPAIIINYPESSPSMPNKIGDYPFVYPWDQYNTTPWLPKVYTTTTSNNYYKA